MVYCVKWEIGKNFISVIRLQTTLFQFVLLKAEHSTRMIIDFLSKHLGVCPT